MKKWFLCIGIVGMLLSGCLFSECRNSRGTGGENVGDGSRNSGNTYFVSNSGNDSNPGTTPDLPWRTIQKVNEFKLQPGDTVCFQKGGIWRGQLVPQSGDEAGYIRYTSYGSGGNPQILGSLEKKKMGDWKTKDGLLWSAGPFEKDVGNIVLDNGRLCGVKVWLKSDLKNQNDFWYDTGSKMLEMYSQRNPAELYGSIECALRQDIIDQSDRSYVAYDGLSLKCGGAHGIAGRNTKHILVKNCVLSFIGGGDQYEDGRRVRYGNGIEFWNSAQDILVENCTIFEIYDAAVTNQGSGENNSQVNITYKGNTIWNCEYSFEYWNGPQSSRTCGITFEGNICMNAGGGWGHAQRPDPAGRHLCFYTNTAQTEHIVIRSNVFNGAAGECIYIPKNWNGLSGLTLERNTYVQPAGKPFAKWLDKAFQAEGFAEFQKLTGMENSSIFRFTEGNRYNGWGSDDDGQIE